MLTIEDKVQTSAQQNSTTPTEGYKSKSFIDTYWLWLVGGLGGALVGLIFYLRSFQKNKIIIPKIVNTLEKKIAEEGTAQRTQKTPTPDIAEKSVFELKNLEGLQNENPSLYISQIQKRLTEYLNQKLNTTVQDLNDGDLKRKFAENNFSEAKQNKYFNLKNAIREAQFAGGSVDLKLLNKQAQEFVSSEE